MPSEASAPEPSAPSESAAPGPSAQEPAVPDRIYRSPAGLASGVLLLALCAWLGGDAIVRGAGRTPWLALAALLCAVPLIVAFTLRPAVYANSERLRVRNPFRSIALPWRSVVSLRSGYSNEVVAESGTKYQLWAVPVSLRGRKRAARQQAKREAGAPGGAGRPGFRHTATAAHEVVPKAAGDSAMEELRDLCSAGAEAAGTAGAGEVRVQWAWPVIAPAVAGAVLLLVLLLT
ncbi:PH domain-containing protein [Streptomyces sp. NPDC007088]|uniref:PH domain-containing protein n=1 Tax=Streptomyces sp. NPDC007088 TaxID=3364773 RepID=UPI0036ACD275